MLFKIVMLINIYRMYDQIMNTNEQLWSLNLMKKEHLSDIVRHVNCASFHGPTIRPIDACVSNCVYSVISQRMSCFYAPQNVLAIT